MEKVLLFLCFVVTTQFLVKKLQHNTTASIYQIREMFPKSFTTECNQKYFIFHTGCPPVRKETNIERSSRVVELCWARCYLLDRRSYKEYTSQQDDAVEIVYILLHFPNVGVPNVTDTVFPSTTHEVAAINLHVSQVRHEYYLASR